MASERNGVRARFDRLRARLETVARDDPVTMELLTSAEDGVARELALMAAILDQLPIAVTLLDAEYRIMLHNRRAREINGTLDAESPISDWPGDLFHLDGTPMIHDERPAVRALRGESPHGVILEVRSPGRPPYIIETSATPIRDADGKVVFAVSAFDDVTARRKHEMADRDFVANAAHQIRTPMAGIASAWGALNAGAKTDPGTRDRFLGHIEREVLRMQQLATGLLALARAERGDAPAPLSMIALRPLLQRVIDLSTPKVGVALELSCPERLSALTNDALMSEALANVTANAVQHTTHGTVVLRGEQVEGCASIEVCDDGPGVPEEDRDRIFERFFRGTRPVGTGVGLGLAIAAAATHAAGGVLELTDSPAGACFRFTFQQATVGA